LVATRTPRAACWFRALLRRVRAPAALSADEREELKQLRAEVATLRMERDVLKRSVVLWVKEATK
jgi:transposase